MADGLRIIVLYALHKYGMVKITELDVKYEYSDFL